MLCMLSPYDFRCYCPVSLFDLVVVAVTCVLLCFVWLCCACCLRLMCHALSDALLGFAVVF